MPVHNHLSSLNRTPKRSIKMIVLLSLLFCNIIIFPIQPATAILLFKDDGNNYVNENDQRGTQSFFSRVHTYNQYKANQLEAEAKAQHRNKNLRLCDKTLLFTNGCMMLKGNLAKESLLVSMIATKVIHQTTEEEMKNFGWILLSWSSFFFSGTASIFRWLINHHQQSQKIMGIPPDVTTVTSQSKAAPLFLLMGSRGMELIGGTVVLFFMFLAL